jgi:hypothetical protein
MTDAPATRREWTDAFFDGMRSQGDPEADDLVARIFAEHEATRANELLRSLVASDQQVPPGLDPKLEAYFKDRPAIPSIDMAKIRIAERFFDDYGPEILLILGTYSLPGAYAARKGAPVLFRTGKLLGSHALRRLYETTQMVCDVLMEGGMEPDGPGRRTIQKVRLMHASIRRLVAQAREPRWDEANGLPINQEDLAGTFTTFSVVVLRGLRRLGLRPSPEQEDAYLHCWLVVARLLGVDESVLPRDMAEADALTEIIRRRQIAPSEEGRALTAALVAALDGAMPRPLHGFAASAMHYFLDADLVPGEPPVTELLAVPRPNWTRLLLAVLALVTRIEGRVVGASRFGAWLLRLVTRWFIRAMLAFERGGERARFAMPTHVRHWLPRA